MAGAGHKLWAAGDVVGATGGTSINTYLQDQIVGVYADSSARDAAFGGAGEPTLAEGMVCYLNDTNELQVYNGSAWVAVLDVDTISVSSGAYTLTNALTITGANDFTIGDSGAQILGPASGSAAAPSYGFSGDPGLGIFRSNTDVMHVATANVARQTWLANGQVLVHTTATFDDVSFLYLQVLGGISTKQAGTGAASQVSFFNDNGRVGYIGTSGSATAFNTSSDYRLKADVETLADAVDRLDKLNPITFTFSADPETTLDGFLAHEVAEVVPQAISGDKDAVDDDGGIVAQGIDHSKLVPLLVAAVQELSARVAALEAAA